MSFNVAIDGPAGAGKSTIARAVAKKKGFIYSTTSSIRPGPSSIRRCNTFRST